MNIGEKIKKARLEKGYTQEELGNLIGVQKSAVAKYEKGRVVNIKRSVLAKISQVLNIPPVELVSDIEEKPVETAERHFEILMDEDINEIFEEFKTLDAKKKKLVKDLVHSLAQSEV